MKYSSADCVPFCYVPWYVEKGVSEESALRVIQNPLINGYAADVTIQLAGKIPAEFIVDCALNQWTEVFNNSAEWESQSD